MKGAFRHAGLRLRARTVYNNGNRRMSTQLVGFLGWMRSPDHSCTSWNETLFRNRATAVVIP